MNGTLYFTADDGTNGWELWKSDGTTDGTTLVKDIRSGSGGSFPSLLMDVGGTLYFMASDAVTGGLWKSDGTADGTVLVARIPSPGPLTNVGGTLFFSIETSANGAELWRVNEDPTADAGGPRTVAEGGRIHLDGSSGADPNQVSNTLTYEWDLDGDDVFGETGSEASRGDETSMNPFFNADGLSGPSSQSVSLRVTDNGGLTDTDTVTITIADMQITVSDTLLNEADVGATFTVTATFGSAMNPNVDPTIAFSPSVATTLLFVSGVWSAGDTVYTANYTVAHANVREPAVDVTVNAATSSDLFAVDTRVPRVLSIVRASQNPTTAKKVKWTVGFSDDVTGVELLSNFLLKMSGGLAGAKLLGVTGGGRVWTVEARTGTKPGKLGLNLVDNDTIQDLTGKKLGGVNVPGLPNPIVTGPKYTKR